MKLLLFLLSCSICFGAYFPGNAGLDIDATELAVNDTTPTVLGVVTVETNSTSATTITAFDDGVKGQWLYLTVTDANTTIDGGLTATGMTIPLIVGDTLVFKHDGTAFEQTGGSVGMGRFVSLATRNGIGDWPASTTTTATEVDVSDDGVRKGACAVRVTMFFIGNPQQATFRNASNDDDIEMLWVRDNDANPVDAVAATIVAPLTNAGKFYFSFGASWTSTYNDGNVTGYYI